jgi:hypothetical protein
MKVLFELREDITRAADMVHRIEIIRSQIRDLSDIVDDASIQRAGLDLNQKLVNLEMNLVDLRLTGQGQDGVRFGSKLISKIGYLARGLASGDFKPTDQQIEVQKILEGRLEEASRRLDELLEKDVAEFNRLLRDNDVPNIVSRLPN